MLYPPLHFPQCSVSPRCNTMPQKSIRASPGAENKQAALAQYPTYTKMALISVFLLISPHHFQHAIYCIDLFLQIFMFNSLKKSWNDKILKLKPELLEPLFKRMLNMKTYPIQLAKTHIYKFMHITVVNYLKKRIFYNLFKRKISSRKFG